MYALIPLGILVSVVLAWWLLRRGRVNRAAMPEAPVALVRRPRTPASEHWPPTEEFDFNIVGESNYQRVLEGLAGDHGSEMAHSEHVASLIPEDNNRHDDKAVQVQIAGETVGYLARPDARSFRRRLGQKGLTGKTTTCNAVIVGGATKASGEKLHYGVRLAIRTFESD